MNAKIFHPEGKNKTAEEITAFVRDWADSRHWPSEPQIIHVMEKAKINPGKVEIDDVEVDLMDELAWDFTFHATAYDVEYQDEDEDDFDLDAIYFLVSGVVFFDEQDGWWKIDDVNITNVNTEIDLLSLPLDDQLNDQKNIIESKLKEDEPATFVVQETLLESADAVLAYISQLSLDNWYRGHADKQWELRTGIAREENPSLALENKLRLAFENQTTFLDPASHPLGVAKCTFLMQHHGLPTRLLDWSISPLTALYFAVCDEQQTDSNACIWAIDPSQLNRQHSEKFPYELSQNQDTPDQDRDKIFMEEGISRVLAIHAPYTNLRMKMQKSEFTLHSNYEPMEATRGAEVYLKEKIIIPHRIKREVRNRLTALGVTRAALFPDLDNIAQTIKDDILGNPSAADSAATDATDEKQAES